MDEGQALLLQKQGCGWRISVDHCFISLSNTLFPFFFFFFQFISGFCCDTRTAVITVNIISLGFAVLGLASFAPNMDRPGFERFGLMISALVIGVICSSLGLFGALKFRKTFVLVAAIWFGIEAIMGLVLFMDWIGAVIGVFFMYPHIMMFRDMQKGIMTRERYPVEKECCGACC